MAGAAALPAALLLLSAILSSSAAATDITSILSQYPDFSSFSAILSQTGLNTEINRRQTITVLAVPNSELDAVSGRPLDIVKRIASVHVVLDYYDADKLAKLSKKTSLLTTLFQSTGLASGQSGFLNVTDLSDGRIAFGSAVPGAGLDVYFVKSVASQPYNISVLEVSGLIVPPGIEGTTTPPPSATPKKADAPSATTAAASPKPSATAPTKAAPAPMEQAAAPTKAAPGPSKPAAAPTKSSPAPSNAAAPNTDATSAATPAEGPSTGAASPATSVPSTASSPNAADATAPAAPSSAARTVVVGTGLSVAVAAAFFAAL